MVGLLLILIPLLFVDGALFNRRQCDTLETVRSNCLKQVDTREKRKCMENYRKTSSQCQQQNSDDENYNEDGSGVYRKAPLLVLVTTEGIFAKTTVWW